jgi:hypothetical protein
LIYSVAVGRPQLHYIKRIFYFSHRLSFSEHPGIAGSFHMIKKCAPPTGAHH